MTKKTIIIVVVSFLIIGLVIGGYFYWNWMKKSKIKFLQEAGDTAEKITESATKGVLPSLETNPLGNKPDINPADKANPFKDIKINPF